MKTKSLRTALISMALLLAVSQAVMGGEIRIEQRSRNRRGSVDLQIEVPSYGPAPGGSIYDGPYSPPPHWYNRYPRWLPPRPYDPPSRRDFYRSQLIPAGRLILMVDPVSAEVFVDGLRLTQRSDLSYEVGLLVGEHAVTVSAEGYEPYDETIDIPGGQHVVRTIRLSPVE